MKYTAEIGRKNPTSFIFLIDQSASMSDPMAGGESDKNKAQMVADAINKLLQNSVMRCIPEGEVPLDRFYVGVIGYGGNTVGPAFGGSLAGKELVPISELANSPVRVEERSKKQDDGAGGLVETTIKFPIWFDPVADGGTPMCEALMMAQTIIENWLNEHPDCFPPIVFNLTDGEATDGDPSLPAKSLTELSSNDGNVLLFNCHISDVRAKPVEFPDTDIGLPDEYARQLFNMSSFLPETVRNEAKTEGLTFSENTRGFVFNADIASIIRFLDIGSRPALR